ncbi:MAG: DUF4192 domain-containing protein [Brachybacterium sp.]|nr:DUF4192 domain-containing protein [Brachybacterium sp.]
MSLVVQTHDELIAAIPHLIGFTPTESAVVIPLKGNLPVVRVDMPRDDEEGRGVVKEIGGALSRYAEPGSSVAVVCLTGDSHDAQLTSQAMAAEFDSVGVEVPVRIWAVADRWMEFNAGRSGERTPQTENKLAAETVAMGRAQPLQSREALAAALEGDRGPIQVALPAARQAATESTPDQECAWAVERLGQFHHDGNRLSDHDGARLLVALENTETRDFLWHDMSRDNAEAHVSLWTDLTGRAPDEVRAPAASLCGFASWLHGDGARAWCALDQVPEGQSYSMADLVGGALQQGLHPSVWEKARAAVEPDEIDESFTPETPTRHPGTEIPGRNGPPPRHGPER